MKSFFVKYFPYSGLIIRYAKAILNHIAPLKSSYSQNKEDLFVLNYLKSSYYNLNKGIYIDIGANHPSVINNTYLFYRNGYHGIVIEPNINYSGLYKFFRSKDLSFFFGVGSKTSLVQFSISKTPVNSSFLANTKNYWYKIYIPILPLDILLEDIKFNYIFFMSIDAEGMDYDILLGASNSLEKTLVISIEANDNKQQEKISKYLSEKGFILLKKLEVNLIFLNNNKFFNDFFIS